MVRPLLNGGKAIYAHLVEAQPGSAVPKRDPTIVTAGKHACTLRGQCVRGQVPA